MADFSYKKNVYGYPELACELHVIANSETVVEGGLVRFKVNTGLIEPVSATETIYGLCEGIVNKDGVPIDSLSAGEYDGTFTSGNRGTLSYAAAADNSTDKQMKAFVRPLRPGDVLSNQPDATIGTTTNSNLAGHYTDVATSIQVDEDNAGTVSQSTAQLMTFGVDPEDSTKGLYMVNEFQAGL